MKFIIQGENDQNSGCLWEESAQDGAECLSSVLFTAYQFHLNEKEKYLVCFLLPR